MDKLETIQHALRKFREDRQVMAEQDSDNMFLYMLLLGEIQELGVALAEEDKIEIPREIADCIIFLLNLSAELGVDVYQSVMKKIARNMRKYPAKYFQGDFEYTEAVRMSKNEYKMSGGDEAFYANGVVQEVELIEQQFISVSR